MVILFYLIFYIEKKVLVMVKKNIYLFTKSKNNTYKKRNGLCILLYI